MDWIIRLIVFAAGFVIGWIVKIKPIGTLHIRENAEKDVFRFEFTDLDNLDKHKFALIRIRKDS